MKGGVLCPLCGRATYVIETRAVPGGWRRRRGCLADDCCGRITTVELAAPRFGKGRRSSSVGVVPVLAPDGGDIIGVPRAVVMQLQELLRDLNMKPLAPLTSFPACKKRPLGKVVSS